MRESIQSFTRFAILAAVAFLTVTKIWLSWKVELLPEEAYYWTYAQHPSLSYFDHPPMVAWIVTMGTMIFGNTEFGVRVGTILLSIASSVCMFWLGRLWFGTRAAWWSVLLFNIIPIFVAVGVLVFPDGPLLFFWLLTLFAISKAIANTPTDRPKFAFDSSAFYWLIAGIAFGCAMLSKYTAVLLAPSLLVFFFFSPKHRVWLWRPEPWIAVFTAALVFSPVIIWNAQHEWASFHFQSTRTMGQQFRPLRTISEFWGVQIGVISPFLFVLFFVTARQAIKRGLFGREDKWNFAVSFFLPLFLIFVLASITTRVHANWTAPAFLSLIPAAAALFLEALETAKAKNASRLRLTGWITGVCAFVTLVISCTTLVWGIPKALTYSHVGGWRDLAHQVDLAEKELHALTGKKPFVLAMDKYHTAAEIGFYQMEPDAQVNEFALGKGGVGYRYWTDLAKLNDQPAVAVLRNADSRTISELSACFDRIDSPKQILIDGPGQRDRTLYLVNCFGYHSPVVTQSKIR